MRVRLVPLSAAILVLSGASALADDCDVVRAAATPAAPYTATMVARMDPTLFTQTTNTPVRLTVRWTGAQYLTLRDGKWVVDPAADHRKPLFTLVGRRAAQPTCRALGDAMLGDAAVAVYSMRMALDEGGVSTTTVWLAKPGGLPLKVVHEIPGLLASEITLDYAVP